MGGRETDDPPGPVIKPYPLKCSIVNTLQCEPDMKKCATTVPFDVKEPRHIMFLCAHGSWNGMSTFPRELLRACFRKQGLSCALKYELIPQFELLR